MFQEAGEAITGAGTLATAEAPDMPLAMPFMMRAAHETPVFRAVMAVHFAK
jgi:hypothetical protein